MIGAHAFSLLGVVRAWGKPITASAAARAREEGEEGGERGEREDERGDAHKEEGRMNKPILVNKAKDDALAKDEVKDEEGIEEGVEEGVPSAEEMLRTGNDLCFTFLSHHLFSGVTGSCAYSDTVRNTVTDTAPPQSPPPWLSRLNGDTHFDVVERTAKHSARL